MITFLAPLESPMLSEIALHHASNQTITINVNKERNSKIPPYRNFGRAGISKGKIEGINASLIFADLSSAATWLFWNLENGRDHQTNISNFQTSNLTQAEKLKLSRGYKELKEKKLVIRVRNQHYLINPKIILPEFKRYEMIQAEWDRIQATL